MFPKSASVQVYDAPDGNGIGTLTRALANSPAEVAAGGWIAVQEPGAVFWVRSTDLSFLPPVGPDYSKAFEHVYRQRAGDTSRYVGFWLDGAEPNHRARLRLGNEDGWQESEYTISNGVARPERLLLVSGAGKGLMMAANSLPGVLASLVTCVAVSIIARRTGRRATAHPLSH